MILVYLSMIETQEDKDKFQKIYDQYNGLIKHVARKLTNDEQNVEDIVQETFLRIVKSIKVLRYENDKEFRSLIGIMTKHCGYRYLSKNKNIITMDSEEYIDYTNDNIDFEKVVIDKLYLDHIIEMIDSLDMKYQSALRLSVKGYKSEEIAAILDISPENVRIRVHRAKKIILERINKFEK